MFVYSHWSCKFTSYCFGNDLMQNCSVCFRMSVCQEYLLDGWNLLESFNVLSAHPFKPLCWKKYISFKNVSLPWKWFIGDLILTISSQLVNQETKTTWHDRNWRLYSKKYEILQNWLKLMVKKWESTFCCVVHISQFVSELYWKVFILYSFQLSKLDLMKKNKSFSF